MQPLTFLLPHSGIRVPHTGYTVTSLKQHRTHDGVAYTATLRLNKQIIGTIENGGTGGPDMFYPNTTEGYRTHKPALEAFAAHCTDERGETPMLESVLSDLVTEFEIGRDVKKATKAGRHLLRLMDDYEGDGGPANWTHMAATTQSDTTDPDRLRAQFTGDLAPGPYGWWQIFDTTTQRWADVTTRPAYVPTDRY